MKSCNICGSPVELLVDLDSPNISSISTVINSNTAIYHCQSCSHTQKDSPVCLESYYDSEYKLWCESESSDSLYEITDKGKCVYRLDRILDILLEKLVFNSSSSILDYGCAKGLLSRKIFDKTGAHPYLYDLTDSYLDYWRLWADKNHFFVKKIPQSFANYFDCIICNFVFEHV